MKILAYWMLAILTVSTLGGALLTSAIPQSVSAAETCPRSFLGFPAWYDGVADKNCNISVAGTKDGLSVFIWTIVMNIIEIILVALGYVATAFILYGGFLFLTSNGKPDKAALARRTILDAVIGLVIAMASIAIVSFIAERFV